MIRVAFLLGGKEWLGGYNYILNLCRAIVKYQIDISPVLFVGNDFDENMLEPFYELNIKVIKDSIFGKQNKRIFLIQSILFGKYNSVEDLFTLKKIDVIFESNIYFGWRTKFSVVHWLPDFQHRHLSHLFPKLSWIKREIGFQIVTKTSRKIMLSSHDSKNDCQHFYSVHSDRIYVVPFAVETPSIDKDYLQVCLEKYEIKQPFFYLPNQFWRHKNHGIVIKALNQVKNVHGKQMLVVSSGSSKDNRKYSYFSEIQSSIKTNELEDSLKLLGMIPYRDVAHLMYSSCAVINPSFFEGWSTTVEEAKSLNKQLIVSNLRVHKEQLKNKASFFNPNSSEELVDKMLNIKCEIIEGDIDNAMNVKNYVSLFSKMIYQIK